MKRDVVACGEESRITPVGDAWRRWNEILAGRAQALNVAEQVLTRRRYGPAIAVNGASPDTATATST